ncbi:MAG: hypothetical protein H8K07_01655 [Nitrospira sp.]|nr:hypothetical protein [Nitrospira sp.]
MEKVTVTMTKTMTGSEDGIHVQAYRVGVTYELGAELAQSFIESKGARPALDQPDQTDKKDQTKKGKGPSENKER